MKTYAKAIVGSILAGLTAAGTAVAALQPGQHVTAGGYIAIAIAVVATFAGVYAVPNAPTTKTDQGPSLQ